MAVYNPETECAERYELEALQSLSLIRMVKRVYSDVPFYKKKLDECGISPSDIKSVADLHKLPFTNKSDFRDEYPYGLFAVPTDKIVRVHASTGTTGKQTVVGYTKNDMDIWANCVCRALASAGGTSKDFVHVAFGYGLFTGGLGIHYGAEKMGCTVIPVSTGNTERQIQIFKDFGSSILCCTPSYALYLGDAIEKKGISPSELNLKAGLFGAEAWTEKMRVEIEKRLKIKAFDIYGLSEIMGPGVAYECECRNGMHVNEDHFIPEIIDSKTGELLPDGTEGELVFTCITKECLPIIRYRTKDIASITHEKCDCGRTFVRMSKPKGRADDMLIIRGVNVFPSQVESVLLSVSGTTPHYMIIVDRINNLDTMEIQLEMNSDLFKDEVKLIEDKMKEIKTKLDSVLGISAKITFVAANSLPRSEGKSKRVIDKRVYD